MSSLNLELLPEDTDEPERLELLDAAIPNNPFNDSVTPVWPRCAPSSPSPAVTPFHSGPNVILYRLLFHASSGAPSTTGRPSESADPSPRLAGEELTLLHALKVLPAVTGQNSQTGLDTYRGSVSPKHAGHRENVGPEMCHVEISHGFHVPL